MFARFTQGFRTLAGAAAFLIVGLLGAAGSIDLTPLVALFVKNPAYLGAAMVCVGLLFGYLRLITKTAAFRKIEGLPADDDDGKPKRGMDAGA
jgi:hypothetical protein